jgi:hypothetical protein
MRHALLVVEECFTGVKTRKESCCIHSFSVCKEEIVIRRIGNSCVLLRGKKDVKFVNPGLEIQCSFGVPVLRISSLQIS